jgi:G3E family GTPase
LQNLLENKDQLKIGVIVNDVASINIDSKLVASANQGIVELQNGCACCSLSDELFSSIEKLLTGRTLDGIVIELSGVADPVAIQNQWKIHATASTTTKAKLENIVTIIDATTFGTDYMAWDRAGERTNWVTPGDDCAANLKIADLLSEQVEAASIILLNKSDLATLQQIQIAANMAWALNKKATIVKTKFGKVSLQRILGPSLRITSGIPRVKANQDADHDHDQKNARIQHANSSPALHTSCTDPNCTDPSHSHDHNHSHKRKKLSTSDLGIESFVYKAQRPFHAGRLMKVLNQWPVPIKEELDLGIIQDYKNVVYETADGESLQEPSPFVGVLRSKGFCWFAPNDWIGDNQDSWRHDTAMYWSMAGRQFGISAGGKWWASLSDPQMRKFFVGNTGEYERIKREDFVSKEFGDRRQEIVFIGTNLNKDYIEVTLNSCLLNNQEMDDYRQNVQNYCLVTG